MGRQSAILEAQLNDATGRHLQCQPAADDSLDLTKEPLMGIVYALPTPDDYSSSQDVTEYPVPRAADWQVR